jgi:hypothetical protein
LIKHPKPVAGWISLNASRWKIKLECPKIELKCPLYLAIHSPVGLSIRRLVPNGFYRDSTSISRYFNDSCNISLTSVEVNIIPYVTFCWRQVPVS